LSYISGIIAFVCLVGYSLTMPHPLVGGNETLSDIYFLAFVAFAGLTVILNMDNK
jgi:hypothetical protein